MKKAFILICIFQLFSLIGSAQGIAKADSVITVIQSGHSIISIDISADQKYALTADDYTIALWDIEKRRIIRLVNHPNKRVLFSPLKPSRIMVSHHDQDLLNGNESFYTYDIFTGKRIGVGGVRKAKDVSSLNKCTENFLLKHDRGRITIKSRKSGKVIGVLNSSSNIYTGCIALNHSDSLLLQTGIFPIIWDLKKGKLLRTIPYAQYAESYPNWGDIENLCMQKRYNINLHHGFKLGKRDTYEGYFTNNDEILLCGYTANITRWSIDGHLLDTIKTDGAPIYAFRDNGKYRVAATLNGLNMGHVSDKKLKDCKSYNEQSFSRSQYCVSPVFRKDFFVTGGDDGFLLMGKLGKPEFRKPLIRLNYVPTCLDINDAEQTILVSGGSASIGEVPIDKPDKVSVYFKL